MGMQIIAVSSDGFRYVLSDDKEEQGQILDTQAKLLYPEQALATVFTRDDGWKAYTGNQDILTALLKIATAIPRPPLGNSTPWKK
jgi:hypothetical protein